MSFIMCNQARLAYFIPLKMARKAWYGYILKAIILVFELYSP